MLISLDMVASPNYVIAVYDGDGSAGGYAPPGSGAIEEAFLDYFQARSIPSISVASGTNSDHAGFVAAGIPTGGLFTGADDIKTEEEAAIFGGTAGIAYDVNYHSAGDTCACQPWLAY